MAELNQGSGGSHKKDGKVKAKKHNTKVDMTPMVDLAFLLLTFFVLTSTFSKPKTMEITFPVPPPPGPPIVMPVNGYTVLLTKDNRVFWYQGAFKDKPVNGLPATKLEEVKFGEDLNKFLLDKNDMVVKEIKELKKQRLKKEINDSVYKVKSIKSKSDNKAPFMVIKADDKAVYRNLIDLIDEFNICNVGKYAVTDITMSELTLLNKATQ